MIPNGISLYLAQRLCYAIIYAPVASLYLGILFFSGIIYVASSAPGHPVLDNAADTFCPHSLMCDRFSVFWNWLSEVDSADYKSCNILRFQVQGFIIPLRYSFQPGLKGFWIMVFWFLGFLFLGFYGSQFCWQSCCFCMFSTCSNIWPLYVTLSLWIKFHMWYVHYQKKITAILIEILLLLIWWSVCFALPSSADCAFTPSADLLPSGSPYQRVTG